MAEHIRYAGEQADIYTGAIFEIPVEILDSAGQVLVGPTSVRAALVESMDQSKIITSAVDLVQRSAPEDHVWDLEFSAAETEKVKDRREIKLEVEVGAPYSNRFHVTLKAQKAALI